LTNTSCPALAREILARAIAGDPPRTLPPELLDGRCSSALFGILVEGLSDRFEPALCDIYAQLFAPLVGADPARYFRVREVRPVREEPARVVVLSRVTLGADVAVTSVLLAAARKRFPDAKIIFAGPGKNCELFPGMDCVQVEYPRGTIAERIAVAENLRRLVPDPATLVIDPDSRLTQLGLLEICPEHRYRFFESRRYGWDTALTLPQLAAQWAEETLGVAGARPFVTVVPHVEKARYAAVSLGVGENQAKRVPDPFEEKLLESLAQTGLELWIDRGAGGDERARVTAATQRAGVPARFWEGSFAGFASIVAGSSLYIGYDSAGQHVASACGIPSITVFAGFPSLRMFHRWRPTSANAAVIRVDNPDPIEVLERVKAQLGSYNKSC
jgi:ADP-heptose:LPS heptosyltransferase